MPLRRIFMELKCWPEFFQAIFDGVKTFEVRKDEGYQVGQVIRLREYRNEPSRGEYTGREMEVEITYILRGKRREEPIPRRNWGNPIALGYCVFSFRVMR